MQITPEIKAILDKLNSRSLMQYVENRPDIYIGGFLFDKEHITEVLCGDYTMAEIDDFLENANHGYFAEDVTFNDMIESYQEANQQ